jgi:hypothetical protein
MELGGVHRVPRFSGLELLQQFGVVFVGLLIRLALELLVLELEDVLLVLGSDGEILVDVQVEVVRLVDLGHVLHHLLHYL